MLEEQIGIISAIILAIIFIILVFILVAVVVTKRRRKVVKYAAVAGEKEEDLMAPIWRPGRRQVAVVGEERMFQNHYLEGSPTLVASGPAHGEYQLASKDRGGLYEVPRRKGGPEDLTRGPGDLSRRSEDLTRGPEDILNISLDSGDSSTGHSNNGGHSLSR